ncbi:hypothetical protein ACH5RR_030186 [Cinchona calisaya]|uniref:Uncharacterized protein n=1 Tax=Cinchona calisaya TaxID=153742 RepID=A0ABD2YTU4_9GENT
MKRQERAMQEGNGILKTISTATSSRKKKGKSRIGKVKKEEVKIELEKNKRDYNDNREFVEKAKEVVILMEWDEWPCLLCAVVEQLSWGTCYWSPFRDMNLMGETSHDAFHSDHVVWDDNIWDLKDIEDFNSPLH